MGTVYRFKVALSGFVGGPGVNTWHMCQVSEAGGADQSDLEGMGNTIMDAYTTIRSLLAAGVFYELQPIVEGFDIETGNLVSVTGIDTPPANNGTASSTIARSVQYTVRLKTDAIRKNRLMQGRHFLGPAGTSGIGNDGLVISSARTTLQSAYDGLLDVAGDGRLVVYGRKYKDKDGVTHPGQIGYVQQVLANNVPGTLRSRKA